MPPKVPNSKKRKSHFTEDLKKEFPYLEKKFKEDPNCSDIFCRMCSSTFSIANGGKYLINRHLDSDIHKKALIAKSSSKQITSFYSKNQPEAQDLELAAQEGVFAFHTVLHNHSFRSMDCTAKIIKDMYDTKFTCSRTKCEAIAVKILSPFVLESIKNEISNAAFVTLSLDCSNHGSTKLLPIQVQYFTKEKGISTRLLDIHSIPGETSEIQVEKLIQTIENFGLESKVIAIGADNTNTNFRGIRRQGKNNVFHKVKEHLGRKLFGIGCSAHIVHNAMEAAANSLPLAVESMIVKIYNYFHIYTVRTEELKEFCSFVNIEYKKLLGSSNTRWLSLAPAIQRILDVFEGVKSYFLSQSKCPKQFSDFFSDPKNELYLSFLMFQAKMFNDTIKLLEKEKISAVEVAVTLKSIVDNLGLRRSEKFIGSSTKKLLQKLDFEGEIREAKFMEYVDSFFETALEYLKNWTAAFDKVQFLDWIRLKKPIQWEALENVVTEAKCYGLNLDEAKLFDEYSCLTAYLTKENLVELESTAGIDEKWQRILHHFDAEAIPMPLLSLVVGFALCLLGTNASVERVFSIMNDVRSSEKTTLGLETLKALLNLKINANYSCRELHTELKKQPAILTQIHSSNKYL